MPLSKLGVALLLPAPPTLIEPLTAWLLNTLPMFCICADSPLGAVVVYSPAVVDT